MPRHAAATRSFARRHPVAGSTHWVSHLAVWIHRQVGVGFGRPPNDPTAFLTLLLPI